jgi:Aspartyl protease
MSTEPFTSHHFLEKKPAIFIENISISASHAMSVRSLSRRPGAGLDPALNNATKIWFSACTGKTESSEHCRIGSTINGTDPMRLTFRNIMLTITLCGTWLAGCVSTSEDMSSRAGQKVSIPFTLSKQNNIVVEARINESDTLHLMLHTASSGVTLTEDAVRRLSGITFGNDAKIQSWGGTSDSRYSTGNRLRIGTLERDDVTVWENKNSGDGTDGKFGLDVFAGAVVEIDFDEARIVVHDSVPSKARGYEKVAIVNDNGELYIQGICLFGETKRSNRFLVHSGYAGGLLLDDAFASSSGIDGNIAITETSQLTDSFGHIIKVKKGIMPGFSLGNLALADVPVGFFSGAIGRQKKSVLGGDILKRFNLIFDISHNALYLKRRSVVARVSAAHSGLFRSLEYNG